MTKCTRMTLKLFADPSDILAANANESDSEPNTAVPNYKET